VWTWRRGVAARSVPESRPPVSEPKNTPLSPILAERALGRSRRRVFAGLSVCFALTAACTIVRDAPFRGAADRVTDAPLVGPFDGRITDDTTGEPVADATVVAVWSFDEG